MKIITAHNIAQSSITALFANAFRYLEEDLKRWQDFKKSPRHAVHFPHGVFELMPCANNDFYTYKYVNAHPKNPEYNKLSIVATGMLADIETGYPQLFCDMTILTAFRTAATSAIATKYLSKEDSHILGIIGTGAQSDFQVAALRQVRDITTIRYYDRDPEAMKKFARNMEGSGVELIACRSGAEVVNGVDIITTCICEKEHVKLFLEADLQGNDKVFMNAIGGDCPGKTELDPAVVAKSRIVVEFFEQTKYEGEIQNLPVLPECTELWEIVQGLKPGRTPEDNWIVFDSVGFGLADFSMMRMLYEMGIGTEVDVVPELQNPKDLISVFRK
jgi:ornithine cyclodeaminase